MADDITPQPDPALEPLKKAEERIVTLKLQLKPHSRKSFKKFAQGLKSKAIENGLEIIRAEIEANKPKDDTGVEPDIAPYTKAMAQDDPTAPPEWKNPDEV